MYISNDLTHNYHVKFGAAELCIVSCECYAYGTHALGRETLLVYAKIVEIYLEKMRQSQPVRSQLAIHHVLAYIHSNYGLDIRTKLSG